MQAHIAKELRLYIEFRDGEYGEEQMGWRTGRRGRNLLEKAGV